MLSILRHTFFSARKALQEQVKEQQVLIHRLLDNNKELQHALLTKRVEESIKPQETKTVYATNPSEEKKAVAIAGWTPPRQRVRDFIEASSPAASLPTLNQEELNFLRDSAQ